ncbi:hypothetical protein H6P81_015966 [Aristolochia fimbriata]|uniref:Uncharacterized protein n=1 Tax=Aristolochia fimbriata TaxID=158543 RepID=A0AAV7E9W8_ARIFI|nr:hypothetical protein H6P81_015966 [Aristolochia fimbriata]
MAFSSSAPRGKAKWPAATLLPNFEFFDLSALSAGTVRCPSPDLDLHVRPYGAFAASPCRGGASGVADPAASRVWCRVGHLARGASGPYEPSSRQRRLPFTAADLQRPCWARQVGASAFTFPSGLVSAPGVLETPGRRECSWTHVNHGSPDGLGWIISESDRPTFAFDRRCPGPVLALFASAGRVEASRSLEMLPG